MRNADIKGGGRRENVPQSTQTTCTVSRPDSCDALAALHVYTASRKGAVLSRILSSGQLAAVWATDHASSATSRGIMLAIWGLACSASRETSSALLCAASPFELRRSSAVCLLAAHATMATDLEDKEGSMWLGSSNMSFGAQSCDAL